MRVLQTDRLTYGTFLTGLGTSVLCFSVMKEAIATAHWTSETAAQALAIAGYWRDLTYFSHELGDARIALVSSIVADALKKKR